MKKKLNKINTNSDLELLICATAVITMHIEKLEKKIDAIDLFCKNTDDDNVDVMSSMSDDIQSVQRRQKNTELAVVIYMTFLTALVVGITMLR